MVGGLPRDAAPGCPPRRCPVASRASWWASPRALSLALWGRAAREGHRRAAPGPLASW